jgi:hypothetical protein
MAATITEQTVHVAERPCDSTPDSRIEQTPSVSISMLRLPSQNEAPGTGPMPMKLEAWPGGNRPTYPLGSLALHRGCR